MKMPHVIVATIVATLAIAAPAAAEPTWAPADSAAIHPGVQTVTEGGQCTSNFVFFDGANNVYIGQAAHCSGTGGSTETDGCDSGSQPLGTPVEVDGASRPGTHGLQLVADHAGQRRDRTPTPAPTTTSRS